ncbi:MAG: WD40 repeat domain-containing protein [Planctomycetales bacterium]|nr:WD40 repeat domain-containing protein [Planctomycetales bacterium]
MKNLPQFVVAFLIAVASESLFATEPPITAITFSPDATSVVTTSQSGIRVHRWPDLEVQQTIKPSAANLHAIAFSPDGTKLAVGGGNPSEIGLVEVFFWPDGKTIATFDGHEDSVRSVVWKNDQSLFSTSIDREIKLWQLDKADALATLSGHSRSVNAACFTDDGKVLVTAGDDQSVRVWTAESGTLIRSLTQHTKPVHALAMRPAHTGLPMLASASADRTIRFWQPTIGRMVRYIRLPSEPLDIAWTPDGSLLVAACEDGSVRIIDPIEVAIKHVDHAIDGWAYSVAVHPTENVALAGGTNGQIRRIQIPTAAEPSK